MASQTTTFSFTHRNQIAGLSGTLSNLTIRDEVRKHEGTKRSEYSFDTVASLRTVDDLIMSLDSLGVPGPLNLYAPFLKKLGEGAQFSVSQGSVLDTSTNCEFETTMEEVAVKLPLFKISIERQLDLASAKSRRQVHDMYLEVMTLQHPALRNHRNIVRLIGGDVEQDWHKTPVLVLELAIGDLCTVLTKSDFRNTYDITQQLSIDVGEGLEAIHEAGVVHGDLKPLNVLVFSNASDEVPFIAKLADFGLSISELQSTSEDFVTVSGISKDWCAPEITLGANMSASQLIQADNFSYGLLFLSVNCLKGRSPKLKDFDVAIEILQSHQRLPEHLFCRLHKALPLLLQDDPMKRPSSVRDIIKDALEASNSWKQDELDRALSITKRAEGPHVHPWKLPSLSAYLLLGLEKSFRRYKERLTGPQLFAMFLLSSYREVSAQNKSLQMDMLLAAANTGHIPAQAVVSRVHKSYNLRESLSRATSEDYLYNGASTGSLVALSELHALGSQRAGSAQRHFRKTTGFNSFYSPLTVNSIGEDFFRDVDGNTKLHYFSARGEFQKLAEALRDLKAPLDINVRNRHGETALYKACMTGCSKTVALLCQYDASSAVPSFLNGLTCLHWLFNFPPACIEEVLLTLKESDGNLNALGTPSPAIVDYHFPFSRSAGTPLHFAVHATSLEATRALLREGARATLRDGRDPYLSDENVRQMHVHGTAEFGESSMPDRPPLGFNAIDLAAAMHEHEVLDCIRTKSLDDSLMDSDEEGYTPFHRLSFFRVTRTSHGLRFWYPAFRGSSSDVESRLVKTIEVLKRMGGDIGQLTSTPARPAVHGVSGLSPLMIAVTKSDYESVAALLKCGADANGVNRDGRSPLMLLTHIDDSCVNPNSLLKLTQLLLDHGAKVNCSSFDGVTPLGAAIASGCIPCIKALIEAGADLSLAELGLNLLASLIYQSRYLNFQLPGPRTQKDAKQQEKDVVAILEQVDLENSSWVHEVDKDNGSLLHYAAYAGLIDCVVLLTKAGLDINQVRRIHFTGPVPPSSYSTDAGYMPAGTALDIVQHQEAEFKSRGQPKFSQEDVRFRLRKFEALKEILECRDISAISSV